MGAPTPDWQLFDPAAAQAHRPSPAGRGNASPGLLTLAAVGALAALLAGGVVLAVSGMPDGSLTLPEDGPVLAAELPAPSVADLIVDVSGAVREPGIVRLEPGARVGDAIAAAGGFSPGADLVAAAQRLNLAAPVTDGEKIGVPALADAGPPVMDPAPPVTGGATDLNRATAAELEALPGIGPVTAGRIVAAREESPFLDVEELRGRGLVSESVFARIRELVRTGP